MPGIRYNMLCNFNTYILYIKLSNMQIQKLSSLGTGDARWMDGWMDRWMHGCIYGEMDGWIYAQYDIMDWPCPLYLP